MCLVLYLGSDAPLATTPPWTDGQLFTATDVRKSCPQNIETWINRPYVYHLGSIDGCGCGFYVEAESEREATLANVPPEVAQSLRRKAVAQRRSVEQLHDYLVAALVEGHSPLHLLASWAGEEDTPPKERTVTSDFFLPTDGEFHLETHTMFLIVR